MLVSPVKMAKLTQNGGKGKEKKVQAMAIRVRRPVAPEGTTSLVWNPATPADSQSRYDLCIYARVFPVEIDLEWDAVAECTGIRPSGPANGCAANNYPTANCSATSQAADRAAIRGGSGSRFAASPGIGPTGQDLQKQGRERPVRPW
jgi:hypothetical protein